MNKILSGFKVNKRVIIKLIITFSLLLAVNCKKENRFKEFINGVTDKNYQLLIAYFDEEITIETGPITLGKFSKQNMYAGFNLNKGYLYALFFDSKKWLELSGNGTTFKESIYDCLKNQTEVKLKEEERYSNEKISEKSLYLPCRGESKTLKFGCDANNCKLQSIWLNEEF